MERIMATFTDYLKNIFWLLLLVQIAPVLVKGIKSQYSDLFESKTKVGVINVKGTLYEASSLVRDIKKFFEDTNIKAIVLKIESPGGAAGTAQTIFNEINYYKARHPNKYIISLVENMAGSGGYYVACAANYVIASPGAFIGSIGSYIQHPYFKEFIEYHKIKYEVIKSGTYKTAGNPLLELTPEQRAQFQGISDDVYHQFVRDVSHQRPHVPTDIKEWADGRIFTGEQALKLKLIDELGSPSTVEKVLKDNAHIEGKIEWVRQPKRGGFWANLFSTDDNDDGSSSLESFINGICKVIETRYSPQTTIH
jgi:protease IV